jgi:N-acetylglucosaminyldiphosphoundecaprenol N-acetyl-beta-D-mannosaminyltransferase
MPEEVRILGVRVHAVTYETLLDSIAGFVEARGPHHICTVNPEFVMEARRNPPFAAVLEGADLCLPDGVGLLWAARRGGRPLPERVTGSDGLPLIARRAAERGWRIFFLGAAPGVAQAAADRLVGLYPGLQVAGAYAGSPADADGDFIVACVRAASPDILFVAFGAPRQDLWIAKYREALQVPVMMGVGGSLDFIVGVQKRAPRWLQRLGLEWFYRLITQPWRWRRQLALPRFAWAVLRDQA